MGFGNFTLVHKFAVGGCFVGGQRHGACLGFGVVFVNDYRRLGHVVSNLLHEVR